MKSVNVFADFWHRTAKTSSRPPANHSSLSCHPHLQHPWGWHLDVNAPIPTPVAVLHSSFSFSWLYFRSSARRFVLSRSNHTCHQGSAAISSFFNSFSSPRWPRHVNVVRMTWRHHHSLQRSTATILEFDQLKCCGSDEMPSSNTRKWKQLVSRCAPSMIWSGYCAQHTNWKQSASWIKFMLSDNVIDYFESITSATVKLLRRSLKRMPTENCQNMFCFHAQHWKEIKHGKYCRKNKIHRRNLNVMLMTSSFLC